VCEYFYLEKKNHYEKIIYDFCFAERLISVLFTGGVGLPMELKLHLSHIVITNIIIKKYYIECYFCCCE